MKKFTVAALAFALISALTFGAAACSSTGEETHSHTYAPEWSKSETHHWKEPTCDDTTEKGYYAAHSFDEEGKCTECGYKRGNGGGHTHSWSTEWTSDETYHWHDALCDDTTDVDGKEEHSFDEDGVCSVCKYESEEKKPETIGLSYRLNSDGQSYSCIGIGTVKDVNIEILAEYEDKPVTAIGDSAFEGCADIISIIIPDSITTIGAHAFDGCSSLKSADIPGSVTDIGEGAYDGCRGLELLTVGEGNSVYSAAGNCLILNATKTMLLGCKGSVIPSDGSVTAVAAGAFDSGSIPQKITVPDSVTSISKGAFAGCDGLTEITLPYVGANGGSANAHFGYIFGAQTAEDNASCVPASLRTVVITGGTAVAEGAFAGCKGIKNLTLPDSMTSIGKGALSGCIILNSLTIPFAGAQLNGTENTHFGYIFGAASYEEHETLVPASLKNVVITVDTTITAQMFRFCYYIENITLPDGVTEIAEYAFSACRRLEHINLPDGLTTIGDYAFFACWNLAFINLPEGLTTIGVRAFTACGTLTSITIPASIKDIGTDAFWMCDRLIEVCNLSTKNIAVGKTDYGDVAYYALNVYSPGKGESKLSTYNDFVFYEDGDTVYLVGYVGREADLQLPGKINGKNYAIYKKAFYMREFLTNVTFSDAVTAIGVNAFTDCINITQLEIPDGVQTISSSAFSGCSSLESITLPFVGTTKDATSERYNFFSVIFGAGEYGFSAMYTPAALKTVVITGGTQIAAKAFYNCVSIRSLTIPSSITSIGENSFYNCHGLIEIVNKSSLNIRAGSEDYGGIALYAKNVYTPTSGESKLKVQDDLMFYEDGNEVYLVGYVGKPTDLVLPDSFNGKNYVVNYNAFYSCESLTSLTIGSGVTAIKESAFGYCRSLKSVIIPDSVKTIESYAFLNDESLISVTIGRGITYIGESAFNSCVSLESVTYNGTKAEWYAIDKGIYWDNFTDSYTLYCTDGSEYVETKSKTGI